MGGGRTGSQQRRTARYIAQVHEWLGQRVLNTGTPEKGVGEAVGEGKSSSRNARHLAYALPHLPTTFLFIPTTSVLMGLYAREFGLSLTTIASMLFIARLFDAITDPVIGILSDRIHHRYGTRKPFMLVGALGFSAAAWALYVPVANVTPSYFLGSLLVFFFFWTVFEIPHVSWGGEIAGDSQEKTRIYAVRGMVGGIGGVIFFSLPLLPMFPTTEITFDVLRVGTLIMIIALVVSTAYTIRTVPNGEQFDNADEGGPRELVRAIIQNKPLLVLLLGFFFAGVSFGMWGGLNFILIDRYLNLGAQYAIIQLLGMPLGILALPLWALVAKRFGKKRTWVGGLCGIAFTVALSGLVEPTSSMTFVFATQLLVLFAGSSFALLAQSILSDIVDYGTWKFGSDRSATYFAAITLIGKTNNSIGMASGLLVAGLFGFDASADSHSEQAIFGLKLGYALIPTVLCLAAVWVVSHLAIDERRHQIIRRRLLARRRRASA